MTTDIVSKSTRIDRILRERYPGGEAPTGAWTELSAELDCTRELLRQRSKHVGVRMVPKFPDTCVIADCGVASGNSFGLCVMHYTRQRIHGDPLYKRPIVEHGTHSRYNHHGCRCAPCTAANVVYHYDLYGWPKRSKYDHLRPESAS